MILILPAAPTHSGPVQEVSKGKCFNAVITMFKSADVNVRPQLGGQPSEAADEQVAPGTAAYRARVADTKRIPTNPVYWK